MKFYWLLANFFKTVNVVTTTGSEKDLKNIDIIIEEQPTGEISLGAGVGSSGSTVSGGISENNFLGKGIRLDTNLSVSAKSISGQFIYSKPNFNYTDNTLSTSIRSTKTDYLTDYGYKTNKNSFSIGTSFEQYENLYFSPDISLTSETLSTNARASTSLNKQAGNYTDLYLNYGLKYDLRNSPYKATEGYVTTFYQSIPLARGKLVGIP